MTLRILAACWLLAAGAASGAPHSLRECRYLFRDGGECSKDTLHYPTNTRPRSSCLHGVIRPPTHPWPCAWPCARPCAYLGSHVGLHTRFLFEPWLYLGNPYNSRCVCVWGYLCLRTRTCTSTPNVPRTKLTRVHTRTCARMHTGYSIDTSHFLVSPRVHTHTSRVGTQSILPACSCTRPHTRVCASTGLQGIQLILAASSCPTAKLDVCGR